MDNIDLGDQPFKKMVLNSLPILSELLPDGVDKPWWKRVLAKIKIWGWNIPIHNGLYSSSKLFKKLFDPTLMAGDIKTPIAITAYIPTIDASVVTYNSQAVVDNKILRPETMPHDNYRFDPGVPVWVLASQSSSIPLQFYDVPLLLGLSSYDLEYCEETCAWYNFKGYGDNKKLWHLTGRGLLGIHGGNATGFAVEDGAVTTNLGACAATYDKNTIIVSIYPIKKANEIDFSKGPRWAQYKLFIGPIYQIVKAGLFLLTDSSADKQQLFKHRYIEIDDKFYRPTVIEIDCKKTRRDLKLKNGKEYPDWKSFNQYDHSITHEIFEESYSNAVKAIHDEGLFSEDDLVRMGNEKVSICVSGGGAAAVDEVAYVAALLDCIHAKRDLTNVRSPEDMSIINLLTGTSAGALTAIYFANLHDNYCSKANS